jgi:hypothetical protein
MSTDIQNLKSFDPFAEAEDAGGEVKVNNQQNYIHIRIQRMYFLPYAAAHLPNALARALSTTHLNTCTAI